MKAEGRRLKENMFFILHTSSFILDLTGWEVAPD
jgi:hypothetical protein